MLAIDPTSTPAQLFGEHRCATPGCPALLPRGAERCHDCAVADRKASGGSGAGRPGIGRFEARVETLRGVAKELDQAERRHRQRGTEATRRQLVAALKRYRDAVLFLVERGEE